MDLYKVFCAMQYLLRTGCHWRALPSDFPKWRTVHSCFAIWSEPREGASLLEQALRAANTTQKIFDLRCALETKREATGSTDVREGKAATYPGWC